jgi:PAS domain S-box-containing protein
MPTGYDRNIFLSTLPASRRDRATACAVVGVSAVLFACAVPFAGTPLTPLPAFVASYQSALAINDLITTVLLLSQLAVQRSRGLLLLACGYLFTAAAAVAHALTFPGLLAPAGLLGAGPQTTVWLYMFWHAAFPLCVLGYALSKPTESEDPTPSGLAPILSSIVATCVAIAACTWLATAQHDWLPILLRDGRYTPAMIGVVTTVWGLSLAALVTLLLRRPYMVLDIWLIVVMCSWLFGIALSSVFNTARFDLGFYVGRLYGLCAASFVLVVLLIHHAALQARLARLLARLRREADSERELRSSREHLFSAVVESSHDAIITNALDGTITAWNRAAEQLFGYPASEAVGKHIDLIVPPDRLEEVDDILTRSGRGEKIEQHPTVRVHRSGREVQVSLSVSPIRSASGEIVGASKTARDITESQRTQNALDREIEERQRVFDTSHDLILVTDPAGNYVQVSPSSIAILGYQPGEMIGRSAVDFIHPDDLENTRNEMRSARHGKQKRNFETRYVHREGHPVPLEWSGSWSAQARRHFFIGRDLTEKQAAEAQIRQAQKMDAVGQLTGGIAHDFNNILTVITGTIGILGEAVADKPELAGIATLIDEAADRGASLTKHLLAFARKQPLQPREVDVNALMLETAKLLRPTLGEHIQITPLLAPDAWTALVDPNQLSTSVLNLALNARDAMLDGGKLALETSNIHLDESYAEMHNEVTAGDYVMIAVSDTGRGIPAGDLERVFEPFFTTKEVGKGTGLGLSMVFGFVKQSGGHIKIYSEEGHGTTVKLYLPRASGAGLAEGASAAPENVEGGHETILVVEDDAMVRRYVITQVASLGYATLEAGNAAEALQLIDANPTIDLLFTDVIMPGAMNGRQLANEAQRRRPALKTLYTSGYTENAIVHHGRLDPGVLLLAKPYRKSELAKMIRTALDG